MAADRQANYGGLKRTVTKIQRIGNLLVGGSGESAFISNVIEWIRAGRDPVAFPASQKDKDDWQPVMVVEPDGSILVYERTPHPVRWLDKHGAIGSGRDYAMAALHLGHCARVAVEVACALDPHCGGGIDTLELEA